MKMIQKSRQIEQNRDFFNLFGEMEPLARELFLNPFRLIEVGTLALADFERNHIANLMLLSLYRSTPISLDEKIKLLVSTCHEFGVHPNSEMGQTVLKHNTYQFEAKQGESGKYWEMYISHFPPEFQESIMNLRDVTRSEAKEEGIVIGEARGEAQAITKTHRAIEMLKQGKPVDLIANEVGLSKKDVEFLKSVMVHITISDPRMNQALEEHQKLA